MTVKLSQLKQGEYARVLRLIGPDKAYQKRLMALGFLPGTVIQLTRIAPLGDPVEIALRGGLLSLRKEEANCLELEKVAQ